MLWQALFQSSTKSLWPIWLVLNELPPQVQVFGILNHLSVGHVNVSLICWYIYAHCTVYLDFSPVNILSFSFSKRNMLLAGLWFGNMKPNMATFLKPLMEEMNILQHDDN